jgi:hypothetical protein
MDGKMPLVWSSKMKSKKQVMTLAESLGVEITHTVGDITWDTNCWSPKGFMFVSTDCHCAVTNEFIS